MIYVVLRKGTNDYERHTLSHHGIKGQKWGIRRYQDENGNLTEAGKKRYQKEFYNTVKSEAKAAYKADRQNKEYDERNAYTRLIKHMPKDKVKEFSKLVKKENDDWDKVYSNHGDFKKLESQANASSRTRQAYAEKTVSELLGKYGNKKVTTERIFGIPFKSKAKKIVEDALVTAALEEAYT